MSRANSLKISVKVDDFIVALHKKKNKEIKDFEVYTNRYKKESLKKFKICADRLRKISDSIENGYIPKGCKREDRYNGPILHIPVNLMKIPIEPDIDRIDSLIKCLKISSSKTISLNKYEYEDYFS